MEEPETNTQQSPKGSDTEIDVTDFMVLDSDGECKFPAKGEQQTSPDADAGQCPMDVDLKGIPSVEDEGKVKPSSNPRPQVPIDMSVESLEKFCKEAARSFFNKIGLISHQINSYNDFVSHGLQELFDSREEITVEPDYDPSKKLDAWRHATIKFGRVKLERPEFWADNSDLDEQTLKLKPVHARLQNMTYSSKMNVEMTVQVYSLGPSEKSKTGKDLYIQKKVILPPETKWVTIGRLPVMVKSKLCWLHELKETECEFDSGGYFLIKGTEKAFIAEEQKCLSRIWVSDRQGWHASYLSQLKQERIYVKLVQSKDTDDFRKVINLYFLGATMPIWIMFFALGVSSDKEAFEMIDIQDCDASLVNIISATIKESHEQCEGFRRGGRARQYVDEFIRKTKFPPEQSFDGYVGKYLFPGVSNNRCKALFLGYMMKCLLMTYSGQRKCDNKDGFRNKRLDLACQLLRRELRAHLRHAERRMVKKPLFKTVVSDCLGERNHPRPEYFNGQNAIVSVSVHQGFNQEDSLVLNRASIERGMFRTLHFKSYKAQIENKEVTRRLKHREQIDFGKTESKKGRADSLEIDGLPYVGASLQSGDIVIGKVSESGEDHSMKLMHTEKGMVEKVVLSANDDGKNSAVVTLRQARSPCVGDKFASMHGQKGVVGLLDSQENFPFTCQGIVPDIVINPHGFPTRQTPGQLLEAALGKGIALGGMARYATPFTTPSVDVITEQLHKAGFSRWGGESVLNGHNGERMQSLVFMGPTFYQRLTHMAEDKVKFRNTGPVHPLTRQPVVDKKRFGGVKFGEMERDCLLAHGATANLHERLFTLSDLSQLHICQGCERVANVILRPVEGGKKVHGPYCGFCKSAENILRIKVPYGAKLLYQELFSMGICLKFETEAS
ncbi:unnamed protein product [Alopecurus aequalis]